VTGVWDESRGKTLPVRGRGHQKYIRRPTEMANDSVMSAGLRKPEIASYALTLSNILDAKSMFPHRTLTSKEFFIRTKMIQVFSFNYPPKEIYMKPENLQELVCFKLTMIIMCKSNIEDFIKAFCLTKKDDQRSTRVLPVYYQHTPSVLPVTTSVLPALLQRLLPPHAPEDHIQPTSFNNQSEDCDVETWSPSMSRA
jgi:hypothetical protein